MSYILDALRRADAERERGSVPGLHAQPAMLGQADAEAQRPTGGKRRLGVGAGLALLSLLALLTWWVLGREAVLPLNAPTTAPVPAALSGSPPAAAPPSTTAAASVATPTPAVAVAPAPTLAPMPAPSVPATAALAPRKPAPQVAAAAAPKPARAASVPAARAVGSTPTAPPSAPTAAAPRVYALSELPDEIRRELPALAIGGAMYSQNAANRMLIVNGQTFHEGDKLATGLVLEQIKLKSAVLEYKGYRYGITY